MTKFFTFLAASMVSMAASAQIAAGDYVIYNVEAGAYLNGGNNWGTKASVTKHGQFMTVAEVEGKYTIDSHYSNGGDKHFLAAGDNTYVDAAPANHEISEIEGGYSVKDANGKYLVSADGIFANFNGDNAQAWQFLTKKQYIVAAIAQVEAGKPGDLTALVPDAGFSRNNQDINLWTGASKMGKNGPNNAMDATAAGMNAERWGGNSTSIDFGTTVTDLPNGKYTIKFQGLYRYNNTNDNTNDVAAAAHADGTEKINSYFIANGVKVPFISIADEASVALYDGKMPFSQTEASEAFTKGAYQQEAEVVVTDGTLNLKVEKLEADHEGTDWTVLDNIELYLTELPQTSSVYAAVTVDGVTKYLEQQELSVLTKGENMLVTLPAMTLAGYSMESQSVEVNLNDEVLSEVEGQSLVFTQGGNVINVKVTSVVGTYANDKINVVVTAEGDNGKTVVVKYSTNDIKANEEAYELFAQEFESLQKQWTMIYNVTVNNEEYADEKYDAIKEEVLPILSGISQNIDTKATWAEESYQAGTLAEDLDEILASFEDVQIQLTQANTLFNDLVAALPVDLTKSMFFQYFSDKTGEELEAPATIGCDYNVGVSNGMVFGLSTVKWYAYADVTDYDYLVLNVTEGTPRVMYNREMTPGDAGADGVNHVEITASSPFLTVTDKGDYKEYVYDLQAMAAANPEKPYVHINAIKGADWKNTTVTSMTLYKGEVPTGINAVVASDSVVAPVKFVENGKLVIVKNGHVFNAAGQIVK